MFDFGLFFSELILFAVAGLVGFAAGWRAFAALAASRKRADARTTDRIRQALTEAQVRRARS